MEVLRQLKKAFLTGLSALLLTVNSYMPAKSCNITGYASEYVDSGSSIEKKIEETKFNVTQKDIDDYIKDYVKFKRRCYLDESAAYGGVSGLCFLLNVSEDKDTKLSGNFLGTLLGIYSLWRLKDSFFFSEEDAKKDLAGCNIESLVISEKKNKLIKKMKLDEKYRGVDLESIIKQKNEKGEELTKNALLALGSLALGIGLIVYGYNKYPDDDKARSNIYLISAVPLITSYFMLDKTIKLFNEYRSMPDIPDY